MGSLGLGMGMGIADSHSKRRSAMEVIENIALMVLLMALGVGITAALLAGFVYWMEVMND